MTQQYTANNGNWYDFLTDMSRNVGGTERVVSLIGGGALLAYGITRGSLLGTALSAIGGSMLYRGTTGHCHLYSAMNMNTAGELPEGTKQSPFNRRPLHSRVHVTKSVLINKPVSDVYEFWHNFENLPRFMSHLESVTMLGDKSSHWKAKAPLGMSVDWVAETTSDVPNERIGWKSLGNSDIPNSGVVEFKDMGDRGTNVTVMLTYEAPGGPIGEWIAWALGEEPSLQVEEDLKRFKMLMETGSVVTTEGQPSGRDSDSFAKGAKA